MKVTIFILLTLLSFCTQARDMPSFEMMNNTAGSFFIGSPSIKYGYFIYTDNNKSYLVLQTLVTYNSNEPVWEYTDFIQISKHEEPYRLILSACELDGEIDDTIAAIVNIAGKKVSSDVLQAWALNTEKKRIQEIPTTGISCVND